MSARISLAELREQVDYAESWLRDCNQWEDTPQEVVVGAVLALIEAVEAARVYLRGSAGDLTRKRLQDALARFDFGGVA